MALEKGFHLGPYEIVGRLGAGGMGEVYRARDPRLAREVAIKVLPASMATDPDRLRRFEHEARATSALNHPNILAIYDIGAIENAPYIVCELLDGETLRDRLRRGNLSPRKTIEYAVQITRGLATAHDKGIIHRDIKPENLFITKDGQVKILDFGLAKLVGLTTSGTGDSATAPLPGNTIPGAVLGTAGYMSPEQVRGIAVDQRSDIFALGAIVFEMLSGKRAFAGPTPVDTLSAILGGEPPEFVNLGINVPPGLDRIIRHCLEKDPSDRFQSARDLEFDLVALSLGSAPTQQTTYRTSRRSILRALAVVGICALVAVAAYLFGRHGATVAPPTIHQLTFRKGYIYTARFARDNQTVVYGAAWNALPVELFLTRVGSIESRRLDLPSADILSLTAKDEMAIMLGRHFARPWETVGTLARAPLAGGAPREVAENVADADLSPDGSVIALVRKIDDRQRLEYPSGTVLATTTGYLDGVRISPTAKRVAFIDHPNAADDRGFVSLSDSNGKIARISGEWAGITGLAWHPITGEIWFTASKEGENYGLYAVTHGGRERVVLRAPVDLRILDVASDGKILLSCDSRKSEIAFQPAGAPKEKDLSWFHDDDIGGLSPDGRMVAFYHFGPGSGPNYAAYVGKTDGSSYVRLGEGTAFGITPDGKWVLGQIPSTSNKVTLWPSGAGEPKRFELADFDRIWFGDHCSFSRDGVLTAFRGNEKGKEECVYIFDVRSGKARKIVAQPANICLISPDGAQVAVLDTTGQLKVYPVAGGSPKLVPNLESNEEPIEWDASSRIIYVWNQRFPAKVYRLDVSNGQRTLWKEIAPSDLAGVYWGRVLMTQDGGTFAYRYRRLTSNLYVLEGIH